VSNLVIVAIPDENDRVWKVSSEKVPHLTMLFLGDMDKVENLETIVEFVQHAASTTLNRFYLPVDKRGELGDDPELGPADVLFFRKGRYDYKAVRDFRAALLQERNIRTAYDSTQQFEGPWKPHLTLGYENQPAKPEPADQDYGFYDVSFNKIAVWTGDYDGPEFELKDFGDEFEAMEAVPMDVAMSALIHAETVSDAKWSSFKTSDYTDEQYAKACLLDRGADAGEGKQRYGLPVREPDGTLNRNGCHAAAAVLSSVGGTGSARGSKVKGSAEQIARAKKKLVSLYKGPLGEDVPEGLSGGSKEMNQTVELGQAFLVHYGVKGMRWGVRNDKGGDNTSGKGETKREGLQRFIDPQGHNLGNDIIKGAIWPLVPPLVPFSGPAQVRLARGAVRGAKAKVQSLQDASFKKRAHSAKSFVSIHNGAQDQINRSIDSLNQKYSKADLAKPAKRKAYDNEVLKAMQDGYKASANSLVNKRNTLHLDVEFHGDGQEFKIHAKEGAGTPLPQRVKHALEAEGEDDVTFAGKILRDADGYIVGFDFDDFPRNTAAHSVELGAVLVSEVLSGELEHYGVKGMHWGTRRERGAPLAVGPASTSRVPHGGRRKTQIATQGGENHPAHSDALQVAEAKAKLKKSGVSALSNQELENVRRRVQLEEQVKGLMTSRGRKFVRQNFESESKNIARAGAKAGLRKAAPHVVKRASKAAATGAVALAL
jgi:2'-5' RNA ligase